MTASTATVRRPRLPPHRPPPALLKNAGFSVLAVIGVALIYEITSHSTALATTAVLAVSTAVGCHARLAMGRWSAAAQIATGAALLSLTADLPRLAGEVLIVGLVGSELIARCARRSAVVRVGMWTGLVAGLASLPGLAAALHLTVSQSLGESLAASAGGFLGPPLMLSVGPVAEWLFGHTTRLTMSEWLSYEHPLLRELTATAPGTFQHSVNVAILADSAAGAIGGDAFLARVGGLYHDVGKIRAPEFFAENQHGRNPHDGLSPQESAHILRSHVSDGVVLVDRHRMGGQIADFVLEHHGTGTMRLFRDKAIALGSGDADAEAFRYPGPRPRSRETGILMVADQVEATARSAPPPDDAACDDIVRRTIARIVGEGELDESQLTQKDLSAIGLALSRALQAMYHRRLSYQAPGPASRATTALQLVTRTLGRRRTGS